MSIERYPRDLVISKSDFDNSGWQHIIFNISHDGYPAMWQAFSNAARDALAQGRSQQGKVLWLLADACSMTLSPKSPNQPFKPFTEFNNGRSVIADDFTSDDIQFFAQIVDEIDESWLKARLSDLLWLRIQPRKIDYALAAIDAYSLLPLDEDFFNIGSGDCWSRAIGLARMLKGGAGDRLQRMEATVIEAFNAATIANGFLTLRLAELLDENWLGQDVVTDIATKIELLGQELQSSKDFYRAREYYCAAAYWMEKDGNLSKIAELKASAAECWVKEADARKASGAPSHMIAATFYENAIKLYRTIPKAERANNRVDERIVELRALLNESGEKSLEEMSIIKTQSEDLTQLISSARKAVRGKSVRQALLTFVNLHQGIDFDKLRADALDSIRRFPLQTLFASTHMSKDGRVIAKRPAMSLGGEPTDDDETAIRAEMIRDYDTLVGIVVRSYIWPALEEILLEHRLREVDFIELARHSPIVPANREGLVGKALFAGYERDYIVALHLLVPQLENMIRVQLKQAGAITTNLDKDGIQNENGLSTLMNLPEAEQVFGKNLSFEIKSLFCDAFGSNLRNELAHGLLLEGNFHSASAIYAWWLILKLIFNSCLSQTEREP